MILDVLNKLHVIQKGEQPYLQDDVFAVRHGPQVSAVLSTDVELAENVRLTIEKHSRGRASSPLINTKCSVR